MKFFISYILLTTTLSLSVSAQDTNPDKAANVLVFTNNADSDVVVRTNLVVYGPPYEANPPANFPEMVKTNGLECWVQITRSVPRYNVEPPVCWVSVINHSTNNMACLRMPAENHCRIALLDQQGREVKKTTAGMKFGLPLSQEEIGLRFRHWNPPNQSGWLNLYPNGIPKFAGIPREICDFSLKEVFGIKKPGDYYLHLQMRLIQTGQDSSGKLHFPVTWLPEVVAKVQITSEDVPK